MCVCVWCVCVCDPRQALCCSPEYETKTQEVERKLRGASPPPVLPIPGPKSLLSMKPISLSRSLVQMVTHLRDRVLSPPCILQSSLSHPHTQTHKHSHTHTHIHTHPQTPPTHATHTIHTRTCTHTHTHAHALAPTLTHTHTHRHTHTHSHSHTPRRTDTHTHTHAHHCGDAMYCC